MRQRQATWEHVRRRPRGEGRNIYLLPVTVDHAAPPHDGNYSFGDKHGDGNKTENKKKKRKTEGLEGGGAGGERAPSAAIKMPRRDGRGTAPAPAPAVVNPRTRPQSLAIHWLGGN